MKQPNWVVTTTTSRMVLNLARGDVVRVRNSMQRNYVYARTRAPGSMSDHPEFQPRYTPFQMLRMGVFEGQYLDSRSTEFPASWFSHKRIARDGPDPTLNYFGVKSRQPLSTWRANGWINEIDPRGWFEWYCRFWMGRRCADDARQIRRWRAFARHAAQIAKNCPGDLTRRVRQRQALLQWSYDPFI